MRGYRWANNLVALFNQEKLRKPPDEELLPTVLNPTVSMNDQNCNKKQINKQINIEEPYLHLTWIIFFQNHIIMATFPTLIMPACIAAFWLLANLAKKVIFFHIFSKMRLFLPIFVVACISRQAVLGNRHFDQLNQQNWSYPGLCVQHPYALQQNILFAHSPASR